jgi:hypothetical protein
MLSKTPMPYMSLRARQKDSQKHPGRPDQPCTKWSTQEVQAEKAEKAAVHVKILRDPEIRDVRQGFCVSNGSVIQRFEVR